MESPPPHASNSSQKLRRSRTGCRKCRENKVKCDEEQPRCRRCVRLNYTCDYQPRPRKKYTRRRQDDTEGDEPRPSSAGHGRPSTSGGTESRPELARSASRELSATPQRVEPPPTSISTPGCSGRVLEDAGTESASILSPLDDAPLQYFRFVMPSAVDSKAPEYSGPAIVWVLARKDPMVMHSVCALAGRRFCERETLPPEEARSRECLAVEHCTEALRLLNLALQDDARNSDLNCILATLWLLISYEQKFGDGSGIGFSTHLRGAAALHHGRLGSMREALALSPPVGDGQHRQESTVLSLTCQLMVWIAHVDGGAAVNGFGGAFCRLLGESFHDRHDDLTPLSRLKVFRSLQRRSDLANSYLWGASYPQDQLAEDLQNSQILGLQTEVGQLRFLLSLLNERRDPESRESASPGEQPLASFPEDLGSAIRDVATRYHGLLRTASLLQVSEMESPSQKRFVVNTRFICSFYHGVVLYYLRFVRGSDPLGDEQRASLREVMALASKAHQDDGDDGMQRFAWQLFVAALESDDIIHRSWIIQRFEALARQGENFRRALDALRVAFREEGMGERRIEYAELVRRGDIAKFVLK